MNTLTHKENIIDIFWDEGFINDAGSVALLYENRAITYAGLKIRAREVHLNLQKAGITGGNIVGIRLDRQDEILYSILGVIQAGCAYVLNPVDFSGDTIAALLTKKPYQKEAVDPSVKVITIEDATGETAAAEYPGGSGSTDMDEVMKLTTDRTANDGLYIKHTFRSQLAYFENVLDKFNLANTPQLNIYPDGLDVDLLSDLVLLGVLHGKKIVFSNPGNNGFLKYNDPRGDGTLILAKAAWNALQKIATGPDPDRFLDQIVVGHSLMLGEQVDVWQRTTGEDTLQFGYFSGKVSKLISRLEISAKTKNTAVLPIGTLIEEGKYFIGDQRSRAIPAGVFGNLFTWSDHKDLIKVIYNCRVLADRQIELNFLADEKLHIAVLEELAGSSRIVKNARIVRMTGSDEQEDLIAYISFYDTSSSNIYNVEKLLRKYFLTQFLPAECISVADSFFNQETDFGAMRCWNWTCTPTLYRNPN